MYEWVAPLVMNPAILRQNNGYPFKTSLRHTWYVALNNEAVAGFMPVKRTGENYNIDNYYVKGDDAATMGDLLDRIVEEVETSFSLTALVHKRHVECFRQHGFSTIKDWKNYEKMEYNLPDNNDTAT